MVDVEQRQKMIPFITCEIPSVSKSANWFLMSMYLIGICAVQIDSVTQPIKRNSIESANMFQKGVSFVYDHYLVVFKNIEQSFLTRRMDV